MSYNWNEILKDFDDGELFKILSDKNASKERKKVAEKMLLEKGLIIKNNENYFKEEIENKYYNLVVHLLKSKSKEKTVEELVSKGLNKESSLRLIDIYQNWRSKQKKKVLPWIISLPILFVIFFYLLIKFNFLASGLLVFIPIIVISVNEPTFMNFKKKKIFKVLEQK